MLSVSERHWWPWLPLLLAQGLYLRVVAQRLPPARDPEGRVGTAPATVRLVGIGDSIIAGIGVERHSEGLVGQVAARLAGRAPITVEWRAVGAAGLAAADLLDGPLADALAHEPELVIVSVGVNDSVRGVSPALFKDRLRQIVDTLAASRRCPAVVFAGVPSFDNFPALPRPLSTLLAERSQRLQQVAVELTGHRGLKVVSLPARLERDRFSSDGFHPGHAGCATWAELVADGFALRVAELTERIPG